MKCNGIVAVIPARMGSSRFPGKPLELIGELPMIEHVRRRTLLSDSIDEVLVATCDEEIFQVVSQNGGTAVMTSSSHQRCTDRVAEAVKGLHAEVVINVQGDEPFLNPVHLDALARSMIECPTLPCANLIAPIPLEMADSTNLVKVVVDCLGRALYFSREAIPSMKTKPDPPPQYFRQLGIIAFRSIFLDQFLDLSPTPLERQESCDMMRAIEHGYEVMTVPVDFPFFGVDTREDLHRAELQMSADHLYVSYR